MLRLALLLVFFAPAHAWAHTCAEVTDSSLRAGVTVDNKLVVKADLTEDLTNYTATSMNSSIATVSPAMHTAHDGIYSFTGVAIGTTTVTVHWVYPDTGQEGDCFVPIDVVFNDDVFLDGDEETGPGGCGCNRTVAAPAHSSALFLLLIAPLLLLRRRR